MNTHRHDPEPRPDHDDEERREAGELGDSIADAIGEQLGLQRPPRPEPIPRAPEEDEEHGEHEHMHPFPIFVRGPDGEIEELPLDKVPRYECDEEGCEDPTHDHDHDHDHEHHDHGETKSKRS